MDGKEEWTLLSASKFAPLYVISSSARASGSSSSSDFTLNLNTTLRGLFQLCDCYIPNATNNVNSTNSTIYFFENSTAKSAQIPAGAYTTTTLPSAIATALTTASGGFATYTCAISSTTNIMTITSTQPFSLKFATNTANSAAGILGYTNTDTSAATSQTASQMVNLDGTLLSFNIQISGNGEGGSSIVDLSSSGSGAYTFKIPITQNIGGNILYQSTTASKQYLYLPSGAQTLRVFVRDDRGNTVGIAGDWYATIRRCE